MNSRGCKLATLPPSNKLRNWLTERLSDQIILSRQSERLLRQVLKDEDANALQGLKLTWAATIDAFVNAEFATEDDFDDYEIPSFLRKQAD